MEDNKIIALFYNRDEEALSQTDARYGTYSRSIAMHILNSSEDAEECVQDSYMRLWETIPPERPESLKAYLGRIVRNISISRLRNRNAEKRRDDMEVLFSELEDCIPSRNDVEAAVDHLILTQLINHWLEKEKKENRKLFVGRYWYGCGYAELAARYGMTENKVTLRLHRMRERLKKYLEREGVSV